MNATNYKWSSCIARVKDTNSCPRAVSTQNLTVTMAKLLKKRSSKSPNRKPSKNLRLSKPNLTYAPWKKSLQSLSITTQSRKSSLT